jgi:hypothetical protein
MVLAALLAVGSAPAPPTPDLTGVVLRHGGRDAVEVRALVAAQPLTAIVFFSATCPCFAAHRERLGALARDLGPRGVRFVFVDSERRAPGDAAPDAVPGLGAPLLRDEAGVLARRLGAEFATETFVLDAHGALRYRGGVDDDRKVLRADAKAHLRDALDALLAGTAPPFAASKALGCALRLR